MSASSVAVVNPVAAEEKAAQAKAEGEAKAAKDARGKSVYHALGVITLCTYV